jgi:cytochrome P450
MDGPEIGAALPKQPLIDFDHYAQHSLSESDRAWRQVRGDCPVAWTEANGGHWVISSYQAVASAFKDWETFSSARTDPEITSLSVGNLKLPPLYPEELDPPEWHPVRRILSELLSPGAVQRLQPRIAHWVTHYIDQVIESGRCDMTDDIACPIPAAVSLEFLGFPQSDWERMSNAFHGTGSYDRTTPEFAQALADVVWVGTRVSEELSARLQEPRDDAMSFIVSHDVDGQQITRSDAEAVVLLVIGGGVDTTTSLASSALLYVGQHPELRPQFLDDPTLLDSGTEEFLRMYPPARTHARIAVRDIEFEGCLISAGDRVLLSEVSACHDESAFPDADQFIVDRFPNRHVAFGLGIHRCPGSHLARAQFKEIMRQVLQRMPDYRVDEEQVVEYPNWSSIGGWARIPATFSPGGRLL